MSDFLDLQGAKDLNTDAIHIGAVANSVDPVTGAPIDTHVNRAGGTDYTLQGFWNALGPVVMPWTSVAGGTLTQPNQAFLHPADGNYYSWGGAYPHDVAPGTDPTTVTGYVQRSYVVLRSGVLPAIAQLDQNNIPLVSDLAGLAFEIGVKVRPRGFFADGDLIGHPGFFVKAGSATEVLGRVYNLDDGNHLEIDCDENSINVNWLGVNSNRTDSQNSAQIAQYLSDITAGEQHTLFFHADVNLGRLVINRDFTSFITNRKAKLSSSDDYIFRPLCSDFELAGFRCSQANVRLVHVDTNNAAIVKRHLVSDILINTDSANATRTAFLYSTAAGGLGWDGVEFSRVRGFAGASSTANLINMDHGNAGSASNVTLDKCHAEGYTELLDTTGSGAYASKYTVRSCVARNCNGKALGTYHVRGGLVVEGCEFEGMTLPVYIWAGVLINAVSSDGAIVRNNKFTRNKSPSVNSVTGRSNAHGCLYEQAQRAKISGNLYGDNSGAGFVIGAGSVASDFNSETTVHNTWGLICASDSGGITNRLRDINVQNINAWGNLNAGVLLSGRIDRIDFTGGAILSNNMSNSGLNTGQASVMYDKTHTEVKVGGTQESAPQLNILNLVGVELGKPFIGTTDVNSYPEYSVSVVADVSTNVTLTGGCKLYAVTAETHIVTPAGSRLFVVGCVKRSASTVPLRSATSAGVSIEYIDATVDWDGKAVVA